MTDKRVLQQVSALLGDFATAGGEIAAVVHHVGKGPTPQGAVVQHLVMQECDLCAQDAADMLRAAINELGHARMMEQLAQHPDTEKLLEAMGRKRAAP